MGKEFEDEVLAHLEGLAREGRSLESLRRACRRFLRAGLKAASRPTRRKPIPKSWTLQALLRQQGLCALCAEIIDIDGKDRFNLTGDHFIPLALGGPHTKTNVTAGHRSCNSRKGAESPLETARRLGVTVAELLSRHGAD